MLLAALVPLLPLQAAPAASGERPPGNPATDPALRGVHERLVALLAVEPLSRWCPAVRNGVRPAPAAYGAAIAGASRRGDPVQCLRLGLRALADDSGTGEDFPRRLWEAAGYADWAERKLGRAMDGRVCTILLDLCDRLPAGQAFFIEGRFLRARRLGRLGDPRAEQAVLDGIVALPGLPGDYLAPACRMLGASLEATGDHRRALDAYGLAESAADRYGAGAECLLGAVAINLRLGNEAEAVRLVRILEQAPAEVIGRAATDARNRGLVALVRAGHVLPGSDGDLIRALRRIRTPPPSGPGRENGPPSPAAQSAGYFPGQTDPAVVGDWIRSVPLTWYDYAEPRSLDDPGLQNPDDALRHPDRYFRTAGQIKLLLLAAQDARRPAGERRQCFREAARRILDAAPDYRRMDAIAASVVGNPGFDMESRLGMLWNILAVLSREGRKIRYGEWRGNALCGRFGPDLGERLAALDRMAAVDRTSPPAILDLASTIASREMGPSDELRMTDLLGLLLRLGDIPDAGALAATAPSWKLRADALPGSGAVALEFSRRIRLAKAVNGVHEALAAALAAHFPRMPDTLPPEYADLRIDAGLPRRGREATFQACLRLVGIRGFDRGDFQFWGAVLGSLPQGEAGAATVADMLHSALRAAPDDQVRSELIVLFFSSADADDPAVRGALDREFAAYRRPADCPLSYLVIRLYEIHRALRLGEPVGIQTAFSDLDDPRVRLVRLRTCLRVYAQAGDLPALRRTIDAADPGLLLSPGFLPQSIPAFGLLGMEDELRSAKEAAGRALREAVMESWVSGDASSGDTAVDLALLLREPRALPAPWVAERGAGPGDPLFQGRLRLAQAFLASDWGRVEECAARLIREYPTRYSFHWYRGLALHRLGRDREASGALLAYVGHAKDEMEYPMAIRLLDAISASGR